MLPKALLAAVALVLSASPVSALWPVPRKLSTGNSTLVIDPTIEVTYNGQKVCWNHPHSAFSSKFACSILSPSLLSSSFSSPANGAGRYDDQDDCDCDQNQDYVYNDKDNAQVRLAKTMFDSQISYTANYQPPKGHRFNSKEIVQAGISRTFGAIFQNGFVPWMLRQPHSEFEPRAGAGKRIAKLSITQSGKDNANTFKPVAGTVDESYTLKVTEAGQATITAVSSTGVLRALETFSQLFFKHSSGTSWYTQIGPISIEDEPKFPHRGVLLDVGRHWFSVDDIKRSIDGLAMNKLNVLHLHVTETQSWPLEIPALPLLAKKGAYAPGLTYSPADIQSIYEYGVHRGVQVIMEIDMPGHVGIEKAYPGLTVAYDERPYEYYCAQPPCGAFKLNNTKVEKFIDTLFEDLLPRISPYSSYFHTGGDEYRANNSILDPDLKTNDMAVLQPLLNRFLTHVHDKIRSLGLIPMVWEEMVLEWNATVADDVVIQSWLGAGAIKRLAESGHKVIDSSYDFYVSLYIFLNISRHNIQVLTWKPSISIVAVANGKTSRTALVSTVSIPSTTGATRLRTGVSSTHTIPPPESPPLPSRTFLVVRLPSGPRPLTPPASTPSCGPVPVPPLRFGGPAVLTRMASTAPSMMPDLVCRSSESACCPEVSEVPPSPSSGVTSSLVTRRLVLPLFKRNAPARERERY